METIFDIEKLLDEPFENLEKDIYNYICNIGNRLQQSCFVR